jgi:hypothetical protein
MSYLLRSTLALAAASLALGASAAPTALDGVLGAEWTGVTAASVTHNAAAAEGNFGTPTSQTTGAAYDIYMRRDENYVYTLLQTTSGGTSAGAFANLYFSLRYGTGTYGSGGSSIGFEVTNDRAFRPGVGGYFADTGADLIRYVVSGGGSIIEAAFDLSLFTSNALGVTGYGLPSGETAVGIRLNLSQSFGYSVAGGETYGGARLGFVDLPAAAAVSAPGSVALVGLGLLGLAAVGRRTVR